MAYKAIDIAKKLIFLAQQDEANGGECLTNLKLQKLLYYQQGYHLAAFGTPLFEENVESWMYGPVVPVVYDTYAEFGAHTLPSEENTPIALSDDEEELFLQVYEAYRDFSAIGLMNKTHQEKPWQEALPHDKGTVISQDSMKAFSRHNYNKTKLWCFVLQVITMCFLAIAKKTLLKLFLLSTALVIFILMDN